MHVKLGKIILKVKIRWLVATLIRWIVVSDKALGFGAAPFCGSHTIKQNPQGERVVVVVVVVTRC